MCHVISSQTLHKSIELFLSRMEFNLVDSDSDDGWKDTSCDKTILFLCRVPCAIKEPTSSPTGSPTSSPSVSPSSSPADPSIILTTNPTSSPTPGATLGQAEVIEFTPGTFALVFSVILLMLAAIIVTLHREMKIVKNLKVTRLLEANEMYAEDMSL